MGIYTERKINIFSGSIILLTAIMVFFCAWWYLDPELMRSESLYAVAASEFSWHSPVVTIHGWATPECFSLFPALASLLNGIFGVPVITALRGISLAMLLAGTVMAYFAASSRRTPGAGFVAAAIYSTTLLALEKGVAGTPATSNAFWLFAAQLVFFQYGVRKSDWNRAWIYSALLLVPGFFSGGLAVLLLFAFPMIFFRRPLSVSSKFRKPGFAVALVIIAATVFFWWISFASYYPHQISLYDYLWGRLGGTGYFSDVFAFPFKLVVALLPWSFITWLPFCVALQSVDKTPIFSRYLRTLVFPLLALLWLFPAVSRENLFYLVGPLAVLTGRFYEIGMWRYGVRMRRALVFAELFAVTVPLMMVIGYFAPEEFLGKIISLEKSLGFRLHKGFVPFAIVFSVLALVNVLYLRLRRYRDPVWMILLAVSVSAALFFNALLLPYRAQVHARRDFGNDVKSALRGHEIDELCTLNVYGFNAGLFYTGLRIRRLTSAEEIPYDGKPVYVLCSGFPPSAEYSWSNLFSQHYDYNGHPLGLWKGVPRADSRLLVEPGEESGNKELTGEKER